MSAVAFIPLRQRATTDQRATSLNVASRPHGGPNSLGTHKLGWPATKLEMASLLFQHRSRSISLSPQLGDVATSYQAFRPETRRKVVFASKSRGTLLLRVSILSRSLQTAFTDSATLSQTHLQMGDFPVASISHQHPRTTCFITITLPSWQVVPCSQPVNSSSRPIQRTSPTPSPFTTTLSISSQLTPKSSVLASRPNNSPPPSSPLHIALIRPASTTESEVIDLTIQDTEDEQSVSDILVSVWFPPDQNPG